MWKAQHWIDHLAPAKRIVAWAGILTAIYVVFLLPASIGVGSSHPMRSAVGWVVVGTAAGYTGSAFRTRKHQE